MKVIVNKIPALTLKEADCGDLVKIDGDWWIVTDQRDRKGTHLGDPIYRLLVRPSDGVTERYIDSVLIQRAAATLHINDEEGA